MEYRCFTSTFSNLVSTRKVNSSSLNFSVTASMLCSASSEFFFSISSFLPSTFLIYVLTSSIVTPNDFSFPLTTSADVPFSISTALSNSSASIRNNISLFFSSSSCFLVFSASSARCAWASFSRTSSIFFSSSIFFVTSSFSFCNLSAFSCFCFSSSFFCICCDLRSSSSFLASVAAASATLNSLMISVASGSFFVFTTTPPSTISCFSMTTVSVGISRFTIDPVGPLVLRLNCLISSCRFSCSFFCAKLTSKIFLVSSSFRRLDAFRASSQFFIVSVMRCVKVSRVTLGKIFSISVTTLLCFVSFLNNLRVFDSMAARSLSLWSFISLLKSVNTLEGPNNAEWLDSSLSKS